MIIGFKDQGHQMKVLSFIYLLYNIIYAMLLYPEVSLLVASTLWKN